MRPYYEDKHIKMYNKDCRQMTELEDNSIQCVVTSPPYWGLRKYSGEQELIWGDNTCEHQWVTEIGDLHYNQGYGSTFFDNSVRRRTDKIQGTYQRSFCSLCGAWKGAYGLEPTPEMYIEHTIEILREIRRVLRKDGIVFWNIGDSYMSHAGDRAKVGGFQANPNKDRLDAESSMSMVKRTTKVLKDKDLCLIPFRIAIACQEDGWWVRSVIIWSKPNPMPESVTDRPTESHEYILMLTKSARYYWDADAVREPLETALHSPGNVAGFNNRVEGHRGEWGEFKEPDRVWGVGAGRNIRTVWEFPTQPYPEAHFAVFPEKLPEICIKAATPEVGCCSKCGAPWERITETSPMVIRRSNRRNEMGMNYASGTPASGTMLKPSESKTLGWQPTCKCNADKVPSIVLDPFMGAGTTLWVAKKLNRQAVGYEISKEYCELALKRNRQQVLL